MQEVKHLEGEVTSFGEDTPLLHAYRRKLIIGSAIIFPSSLMVLFPGAIGNLIGVSAWIVELSGVPGAFGTLWWLAYGMKCPSCGINLFWYAVGYAKNLNWLDWVFHQSVCPKCGYKHSA